MTSYARGRFLNPLLSNFSRHLLWAAFTVYLLGGNVSDPFPTHFLNKSSHFKGRKLSQASEHFLFL